MSEATFELQLVKYQNKVHKRCILSVNEERKEAKILETKNHIFFTNRQVYFLNKQVPLLTITSDASTTVDLQGKLVTVNTDILLEARDQEEASKIAELFFRPRKEAEFKSRQMLLGVEGSIRGFLKIREEALCFLANLRRNPRKIMLELSSTLGEGLTGDPVEAMTRLYSERLAKSWEDLISSLSGIEMQVGKDRTNRLYAVTYFIGKLQDAFFEGKDPMKLDMLKGFGLELGFDETIFVRLSQKNASDGLLDLFRNIRLIDFSENSSVLIVPVKTG
jgi:hypothetical protein